MPTATAPPLPRAALAAALLCAAAVVVPAAAQSNAVPAGSDDALRRAPPGLLPARLPVDDRGADGWRLRAHAASFDAADAVPVRGFSGAWDAYAPRAGRNAAVEVLQAETSASRRGWEVALVGRSEIVIDGSRGAWDVVRADKQRQAPPPGTRLDADAAGHGVAWVGVRGARSWRLGEGAGAGAWQFTLGATLLSVRRVQTVRADGRVAYDGTRYAFDAAGSRQDSYREFEGYGAPKASGAGVSADLGLAWRPSGGTFVNLSLVDLLSAVRVDHVATQEVSASSATASVNADGYVSFRPLLSGRYSSQTVRTRLARKTALLAGTTFDAPWGATLAGVRVEHIAAPNVGGLVLPAAWAVLPLPGGVALQLDAETRFRSLGVGVTGRWGGVFVRTRSLPVGQSRTLGWQVALSVPL